MQLAKYALPCSEQQSMIDSEYSRLLTLHASTSTAGISIQHGTPSGGRSEDVDCVFSAARDLELLSVAMAMVFFLCCSGVWERCAANALLSKV